MEAHIIMMTPGDTDAHDGRIDGNEAGCSRKKGNLLRLSSIIDIDNPVTMGCAGAVITRLQRMKTVIHTQSSVVDVSFHRIASVSIFNLNEFMYVEMMLITF